MKLKREDNKLIVEIDLLQKIINPYMEDADLGEMDNVVGVIAGDEQGIYQLIDMDYKGKPPQLGSPIVLTYFEDKEFRKLCAELKIDVWEYETCVECGKVLWGSFTMNGKGNICLEHEKI